ncbi:MAG: hypothetical protein ACR2RF_23740, partial [Geminicoccaceae bacterium]
SIGLSLVGTEGAWPEPGAGDYSLSMAMKVWVATQAIARPRALVFEVMCKARNFAASAEPAFSKILTIFSSMVLVSDAMMAVSDFMEE